MQHRCPPDQRNTHQSKYTRRDTTIQLHTLATHIQYNHAVAIRSNETNQLKHIQIDSNTFKHIQSIQISTQIQAHRHIQQLIQMNTN